MKFVLFYHSLVSDWNHGNAHFLRGIVTELLARGHAVDVYEPCDGWSMTNLGQEHGEQPLRLFSERFPQLTSTFYDDATLDLNAALDGADVVIVHEWNEHELVVRIGRHRAAGAVYRLLFHDTHHRSVTDPASMAAYDLCHYDGVLAFGRVIRDLYLRQGWTDRAWVWHEAADVRLFRPLPAAERAGDFVWIGNWGDGERTEELNEYLLRPVKELNLRARVHGVRYPAEGLRALEAAGIEYAGWLPNSEAPRVFSQFGVTVHVPRRPYRERLPGIPTIRVFEALACGIPLVSAPWEDAEGLFAPGEDFLVARDGNEMTRQLRAVLSDEGVSRELAERGRRTILERHTCGHRVEELLGFCRELEVGEDEKRSQKSNIKGQKAKVGRDRDGAGVEKIVRASALVAE